jgi:hypothetical protein
MPQKLPGEAHSDGATDTFDDSQNRMCGNKHDASILHVVTHAAALRRGILRPATVPKLRRIALLAVPIIAQAITGAVDRASHLRRVVATDIVALVIHAAGGRSEYRIAEILTVATTAHPHRAGPVEIM